MPTNRDPLSSDQNGDDVVELQRDDRRPPRRRPSDDPGAIVTPDEVPEPSLAARVEQRHASARERVGRTGLNRLVVVAQATGEPEIVLPIGPARGLRDDVLDFEQAQDVLLRAQTIPTAVACLGQNSSAQSRDVRLGFTAPMGLVSPAVPPR